jgi:hypothetical protein
MVEKIVFTLSDGKEVDFDFSKVTRKEYRALFDASQSNEAGDEVVSRITGLTIEQLDNMPQLDWARLIREIVRRANNPDPT